MSSPFNDPEARAALFSMVADKEAEACKDMAEELFKADKIDSALCVVDRARMKNPNHRGLTGHFACYVVLRVAAEKKCWYAVLGIRDHAAGVDVIKKRYEALVQLFKPDRCSSVGAETANKLINEAWEVLSDPQRREAFDLLMGYQKITRNQAENQSPEISENDVVVKLENQDPENDNCNRPIVKLENQDPENNNCNLPIVKLENQDPENNNCNRPKPTLVERLRQKAASPATSSTASSSSPSSFLHKTKKFLVVRRNSGQTTGNSGHEVIIVTRKPLMKK